MMRFWEAMRHLEEGKKVRIKDWEKGSYLQKDNWSEKNDCWTIRAALLCSGYWELYEEPQETYNFFEVVRGLREGKRFRRLGKTECGAIKLSHASHSILNSGFHIEDFEAEDWIEVT